MNVKQGNLENIILNALWNLEENEQDIIDVSNIQNKINVSYTKKWAYTTVKTVLDRLVEKKEVDRIKEGKKYYYRSRISRKLAGEQAVDKVVRQYYNNNFDEFLMTVEKIQSEKLVLV